MRPDLIIAALLGLLTNPRSFLAGREGNQAADIFGKSCPPGSSHAVSWTLPGALAELSTMPFVTPIAMVDAKRGAKIMICKAHGTRLGVSESTWDQVCEWSAQASHAEVIELLATAATIPDRIA